MTRLIEGETVSVGEIILPQPRYREIWGESFGLLTSGLASECIYSLAVVSILQILQDSKWTEESARSPVLEWDC